MALILFSCNANTCILSEGHSIVLPNSRILLPPIVCKDKTFSAISSESVIEDEFNGKQSIIYNKNHTNFIGSEYYYYTIPEGTELYDDGIFKLHAPTTYSFKIGHDDQILDYTVHAVQSNIKSAWVENNNILLNNKISIQPNKWYGIGVELQLLDKTIFSHSEYTNLCLWYSINKNIIIRNEYDFSDNESPVSDIYISSTFQAQSGKNDTIVFTCLGSAFELLISIE